MKKIIFLLFLIPLNNLLAQTNMNIYLNNGTIWNIPVSSIDSINYSLNTNVCPATLVDTDGNVYNTVLIGNQCWMKENLNTRHFKNGALIQSGLSDPAWQIATTGAYSDYYNDANNSAVYGRLYNWYAVADPAGLCPTGWHEPEDWEWNVLVRYIDHASDTVCNNCNQSLTEGGALKEIGITHWASPNTAATNSSSFTAFAGGYRSDSGTYFYLGYNGGWWSASSGTSSDAYFHYLSYSNNYIFRGTYNKSYGFSVRCVKD
jgi:uncharacterized protein (TIGR02145 family)